MDKKVNIISVLASDQEALAAVQKKINQWITTKLLAKYKVFTTSEYVVFNICLYKQPQK
jgi:hypothetical protein